MQAWGLLGRMELSANSETQAAFPASPAPQAGSLSRRGERRGEGSLLRGPPVPGPLARRPQLARERIATDPERRRRMLPMPAMRRQCRFEQRTIKRLAGTRMDVRIAARERLARP